jgi:hypothetical protein
MAGRSKSVCFGVLSRAPNSNAALAVQKQVVTHAKPCQALPSLLGGDCSRVFELNLVGENLVAAAMPANVRSNTTHSAAVSANCCEDAMLDTLCDEKTAGARVTASDVDLGVFETSSSLAASAESVVLRMRNSSTTSMLQQQQQQHQYESMEDLQPVVPELCYVRRGGLPKAAAAVCLPAVGGARLAIR